VQNDRELPGDGDLGLAEAVSLGELGSPSLQLRPFRHPGQQHAGCLEEFDRLARNVAFISRLMESGVEFVAADMPFANKLTIHILAAVAEHEREAISGRTKAALAAAKARETKLGTPGTRPVPLPA
jgi:hypothetical protein